MLLVGVIGGACATRAAQPVTLAVVVDESVDVPATTTGLVFERVNLPAPDAPPVDTVSPAITRAHAAYSQGEFDTCRSLLGPIDLGALLSVGDRSLAARTLSLDVACAFGAQSRVEAAAGAAKLAALGLDLPDLPLARDVEALLGEAIAASGTTPRHPFEVNGVPGARLTVDGRAAGCVVPCRIELAPGEHALSVVADNHVAATRWVTVPDAGRVHLDQDPAPPLLAGRQWRARVASGFPPDDDVGAALLFAFAGQRRVALLQPTAEGRVTGALVVDGRRAVSGTRAREGAGELLRDLAYDAGVLRRPSVWQRPWFWIAAAGAVMAVAGVVVAVTYEPETVTTVEP